MAVLSKTATKFMTSPLLLFSNGTRHTVTMINVITRYIFMYSTAKCYPYSIESMVIFGNRFARNKCRKTEHGQDILIVLSEMILLNGHKHHDKQSVLRKRCARLTGFT